MIHDYHEELPGYDPAQILHDDCAECEKRSEHQDHGISNLDRPTFAHAWDRAAQWNQLGLSGVSYAEVPLLNTLWAVQVQLERYGQPIGTLPGGAG